MRTDGIHSEHGRRDEDGRQPEAQDFSLGIGRNTGKRDRDVEAAPWFTPVDSEDGCKDGFCPVPQLKPVDMVNHPPHYSNPNKKIETIDKIEDAVQFAPNPILGGLQWQVLKYMDRLWDKKNPKQDAEKARWYLNRLIQKLED